jgi:hypothetical protein
MLDFGPLEEDKPKKRTRWYRSKITWVIFIFLLLVILGIVGFFVERENNVTPLPENIVNSILFPAYYPSANPAGFKYVKDSAKISSGFLYYKFANGSKVISVTEQEVPQGVNLHALPNYNDFQLGIGKAVIGTSLNKPSAVILTPTTLVNLTSAKFTTKNQLIIFAQSLALMKSQTSY